MFKKVLFLLTVFILFLNARKVNTTSGKVTKNVFIKTKMLPVFVDYNIPYLQRIM